MTAYYNENDPKAAAWLRELIKAGLIANGEVDERSITDVKPEDLKGYAQCHFFAGIGGWSLALRLAGWPDDRQVWTGSCPCQPFSAAGKQEGFKDPRHLWPVWRKIINRSRPTVVFGEQVASASKWLRLVRRNLEKMGYSVGAIPMEAASAGADHLRDRYWFVADRDGQLASEGLQRSGQLSGAGCDTEDNSVSVADSDYTQRRTDSSRRNEHIRQDQRRPQASGDSAKRGDFPVVDAESRGWGEGWTEHEFRSRGFTAAVASIDGCQYVQCPDRDRHGNLKWRRLPPPRVRWLGNGIPARVAKLRGFGNAIDPRPASAFIAAYVEASQHMRQIRSSKE